MERKISQKNTKQQCFGYGFVWIRFILVSRIRIRIRFNESWKISTKIIRILYIFFKTIKLMFTDINIYPINNKTDHISEKYIFYRKKKVDIFPILGGIWSRIRIRYFRKQIRGSGSISKLNGSETLLNRIRKLQYKRKRRGQ